MTSLHFAAEAGSMKIAQWLIFIGENLNARAHCGRTPLDWAEENQFCLGPSRAAKNAIANLIRKHGGKKGEELKAEGK